MVLGAGTGSRLKPFSTILPKPLIPVLGVPSIEYSLLSLRDAGVKQVIVNVHAHAPQMIEYLQSAPVKNLNLSVSDESYLLMGSAGGFRQALDSFGDQAFFSMNADVLTLVDLAALERRHQELVQTTGVWMTLVLMRGKSLDAQTGSYREIFVDESSGLVVGFGEKKNRIPFYSGVAIFDPRCFRHLPSGQAAEFVPQVLEPMIQQKKVGFLYSEALWLDVGSPEQWWKVHFDLNRANAAQVLPSSWQEVIRQQSPRVFVSENEGVVNYDDARPLGKNYIQLEGIKYAIPGLGT